MAYDANEKMAFSNSLTTEGVRLPVTSTEILHTDTVVTIQPLYSFVRSFSMVL